MSQPRPLLSPPETEEQLLAQAQQLSGYTLGETGGTCRAGYAREFKTR